MNNVYREAFVFDCALNDRVFYQPKDGQMKLQFFHIADLCRFMDIIVEKKPEAHIFNVGNKDSISVNEWVKLCYNTVGKEVEFADVTEIAPPSPPAEIFTSQGRSGIISPR